MFSNYSKADVVTVPIGNGLSVNVTTGSNTPTLQYINNNTAATQVNLGDDGTTSVPLQFQFSYFGKTFGASWMHSNGVVSFQDPSITGNFCCSGEVLNNTTNSRYNYAIMPLWTDLYGRTGKNTYYLSTPDSITYGWYGTGQYGNGNNKSSFEVKLDADGAVDMRWGKSAITNATVTMGFTGDLSKGQYYQFYNGNNIIIGGMGVTLNGTKIADPVMPITKVPAAVYTAAPATMITSVEASSIPTTAVSVGGVQLSTTGEIAAPDNIPQALKDAVASVAASPAPPIAIANATTADPVKAESNKAGPSATVMNAVKQIQAADKAVQARAVQNANQQMAASSSRAQEQAMSVVDTLNSMSSASIQTAGSNSSQSSSQLGGLMSPQTTTQQSGQLNFQSNTQVSMIQSYQPAVQSLLQTYTQPVVQESQAPVNLGMPMLLPKITTMVNTNQSNATQNENPLATSSISTRGNVVNEAIDFKLTIESFQSEMKTDAVNKNVQPNDIAGSISIAAMAVQPKGYELYSVVISDVAFYAPKDIYKNQTNVDNARALRQLGSDRLHLEMVNQQFKIGN